MPTTEDLDLPTLLKEAELRYITLDTSIFHEKGFNFEAGSLARLSQFKHRRFSFVLPSTIKAEVTSEVHKRASDAYSSLKKSLGNVLYFWNVREPTREEILFQCTQQKHSDQAVSDRFANFIDNSACEVLEDGERVDTRTILQAYHSNTPPFGKGKKKSEFPDAYALFALESFAEEHDAGILVVSKDNDWKSFCCNSDRLFYMSSLEDALAFLQDPPLVVAEMIHDALEDTKSTIFGELQVQVERVLHDAYFDVNADAACSVQAMPWGQELKELLLNDGQRIQIIDVERCDLESSWRVYASVPLHAVIEVHIELEFSVWDSVDSESVGMGSRGITHDLEITTKCTAEFFWSPDNELLELVDVSLEDISRPIDLGYVEVFEPE